MAPGIRKSITTLTDDELDKVVYAFYRIQSESIGEPGTPNLRSFYYIAGLHGQPFRGAGYANSAWWGGYCHHGNVLFLTWHRAYLFHLEKALQSYDLSSDVFLPYWDEMDGKVPDVLLQPTYTFHDEKYGGTISNPLFSYKMQQGFFDKLQRSVESASGGSKLQDYSKYGGYSTVRCPYSGLVGKDDRKATMEHNWQIDALGVGGASKVLNQNVDRWMKNLGGGPDTGVWGEEIEGARGMYQTTLEAPNYTVFSNTTSSGHWNDYYLGHTGDPDHQEPGEKRKFVVALERSHNSIHLAVGGYDLPDSPELDSRFQNANGDMGENDTVAFDPIFHLHHCFVDRVFWSWQEYNTKNIMVIPDYPGTSSVDSQGPTPKMVADSRLDENTLLHPFRVDPLKPTGDFLTSTYVADTEKNLGYKYDSPLDKKPESATEEISAKFLPTIRVSGINRGSISGSFIISVKGTDKEDGVPDQLLGYEPVFSRWHVNGCANCQNTLMVTAHMPLKTDKTVEQIRNMKLDVTLVTPETKTNRKKERSVFLGGRREETPQLDVGKIRV